MNPRNFRVTAPEKSEDDDVTYLERFRAMYPNGLGPVENRQYLALCKKDRALPPTSSKDRSSDGLGKYLEVQIGSSEEIIDVHSVPSPSQSSVSSQSQPSRMSVTLTPGKSAAGLDPVYKNVEARILSY